jgi:hypothetical protein
MNTVSVSLSVSLLPVRPLNPRGLVRLKQQQELLVVDVPPQLALRTSEAL